ncbi:hypothetical protein C1645_826642 [Glomus cerebriforme]|uniref:Uncharacterized protein n=1 Tax=Glomus cerebriforme TaxID=658196 RepID=A0A397SQ06_9GLOM|nr:hypothetical protein C1645_826642 [Glomus cerebriforme]
MDVHEQNNFFEQMRIELSKSIPVDDSRISKVDKTKDFVIYLDINNHAEYIDKEYGFQKIVALIIVDIVTNIIFITTTHKDNLQTLYIPSSGNTHIFVSKFGGFDIFSVSFSSLSFSALDLIFWVEF